MRVPGAGSWMTQFELSIGRHCLVCKQYDLKSALTFFERDKFDINTMQYRDIIVNIHTPITGKIKG
jgi:hypothetical protein